MDASLLWLVLILVALIAFDLASLRFGRDSRHTGADRRDWW